MKKTAAITLISAIAALSAALSAPAAFAGERHGGDHDDCRSCSDDRDDDRGHKGGHDDGGLLGLDLGNVVDDLLDTVGNLL